MNIIKGARNLVFGTALLAITYFGTGCGGGGSSGPTRIVEPNKAAITSTMNTGGSVRVQQGDSIDQILNGSDVTDVTLGDTAAPYFNRSVSGNIITFSAGPMPSIGLYDLIATPMNVDRPGDAKTYRIEVMERTSFAVLPGKVTFIDANTKLSREYTPGFNGAFERPVNGSSDVVLSNLQTFGSYVNSGVMNGLSNQGATTAATMKTNYTGLKQISLDCQHGTTTVEYNTSGGPALSIVITGMSQSDMQKQTEMFRATTGYNDRRF